MYIQKKILWKIMNLPQSAYIPKIWLYLFHTQVSFYSEINYIVRTFQWMSWDIWIEVIIFPQHIFPDTWQWVQRQITLCFVCCCLMPSLSWNILVRTVFKGMCLSPAMFYSSELLTTKSLKFTNPALYSVEIVVLS